LRKSFPILLNAYFVSYRAESHFASDLDFFSMKLCKNVVALICGRSLLNQFDVPNSKTTKMPHAILKVSIGHLSHSGMYVDFMDFRKQSIPFVVRQPKPFLNASVEFQ
jgi:hypothetical protein